MLRRNNSLRNFRMIRIGILSLQGDVSEHVSMMTDAMRNMEIRGNIIEVKDRKWIKNLDALVIPGGESTTIGKLISMYGLDGEIKNLAEKGIPILGTCAGLILLANEGDKDIERTKQPLLRLMDMKVKRNAFGRQRESFETDLEIPILGNERYHAVFIRAPAIEKIGKGVRVLAKYDNRIVAAQQDNLLALAFHPELGNDTRLHEYFLRLIKNL